MLFGVEKLEWCGYPMVENVEDTFISFDMIHKRDRHTHTYTHRHRMTAKAALA